MKQLFLNAINFSAAIESRLVDIPDSVKPDFDAILIVFNSYVASCCDKKEKEPLIVREYEDFVKSLNPDSPAVGALKSIFGAITLEFQQNGITLKTL